MSIGEVLALLKGEFPDVTISKIRFLESQGLLDPERTPSGYRKFYEADIERLRWILRQQRENFLPLKVIRGRLGSDPDAAEAEAPALVGGADYGREEALERMAAEREPQRAGAGRAVDQEVGVGARGGSSAALGDSGTGAGAGAGSLGHAGAGAST